MKPHEVPLFLSIGLCLWVAGTAFFSLRGANLIEGSFLRYWITMIVSAVGTAALCAGILHWHHIPHRGWASAMLLLALPGFLGEVFVLACFTKFMPRLQAASAGRYAALLFATYAAALAVGEAITAIHPVIVSGGGGFPHDVARPSSQFPLLDANGFAAAPSGA